MFATEPSPVIISFGPLPADHPIYASIGRVVAAAASFEHRLDALIWSVLRLKNRRGAAVTAQMVGAHPRLNALIALCNERGWDDAVVELRQLARKCHKPYDRRNRVVHDAWFWNPETKGAKQLRAMPRNDLQYGLQDVDERYLASIIADFEKLNASLSDIAKMVKSRI